MDLTRNQRKSLPAFEGYRWILYLQLSTPWTTEGLCKQFSWNHLCCLLNTASTSSQTGGGKSCLLPERSGNYGFSGWFLAWSISGNCCSWDTWCTYLNAAVSGRQIPNRHIRDVAHNRHNWWFAVVCHFFELLGFDAAYSDFCSSDALQRIHAPKARRSSRLMRFRS